MPGTSTPSNTALVLYWSIFGFVFGFILTAPILLQANEVPNSSVATEPGEKLIIRDDAEPSQNLEPQKIPEDHPLTQKGYLLSTPVNSSEQAGAPQDSKNEPSYNYKNSASPRLGIASRSDGSPLITVVGFSITPELWNKDSVSQWRKELAVDWMSNAVGHVFFNFKRMFNGQGEFRPSLNAAIDLQLAGVDGIAAPLRTDRYGIRLGASVENTINTNVSLKAAIELRQGPVDSLLVIALGYVWAW